MLQWYKCGAAYGSSRSQLPKVNTKARDIKLNNNFFIIVCRLNDLEL